ncbi:MAG: hypothetical protein H7Z40_09625 [Phycisphaerae bacterium]|nr:hypothetical protein [Gemmatimonadaceae bacterium]
MTIRLRGDSCLPASVGSYVWYDQDYDGKQDDSESGMSGRVVTLSGNGVSKSATTDSYGKYKFSSLNAGTYTICSAVPNGYKASPTNRTGDSDDSDGTGSNNCASVRLAAGQYNSYIDFGFDKK